jgi:hypothetical protein
MSTKKTDTHSTASHFVHSMEWISSDALLKTPGSDDMVAVARDLSESVQGQLYSSVEKYYVQSLKHLLDAGEITFVGFMIRLNNLYPQEMAGVDAALKQRVHSLLHTAS